MRKVLGTCGILVFAAFTAVNTVSAQTLPERGDLFPQDVQNPEGRDPHSVRVLGVDVLKEFFVPAYSLNGKPSEQGDTFVIVNAHTDLPVMAVLFPEWEVMVRAANSHDELVAALGDYLERHRSHPPEE